MGIGFVFFITFMTDLRDLLAINLKKLRKERGLSQEKLAEKANISTQFLGMIEVKRQFPSPEMLKRIAKALDVDTPELFSIPPANTGSLQKLHKTVLEDLQIKVARVVRETFSDHINELG